MRGPMHARHMIFKNATPFDILFVWPLQPPPRHLIASPQTLTLLGVVLTCGQLRLLRDLRTKEQNEQGERAVRGHRL